MSTHRHISPLALSREGGIYASKYRIVLNNQEHLIDSSSFNKEHHIDGVIRIINDEYAGIDISKRIYTHFNLEFCGHRIGATYALPRIIEQGYFHSPEDEKSPLLSFDDCVIAECTGVREHVPYKALHKSDFTHAMTHIQGPHDLQMAIIRRYGVSMPGIPKNELIRRGVAITKLRILRKFN